MISGGEFPLNLKRFEPFQATLPIDLDKSTRGPLPNAANQPIPEGKVEANDIGYIRFEDIPSLDPKFGKVRAVRVQANSEVPGLFGKEGGGWSHYSVVIEETGLAYAQIVVDGAKGIYGDVYDLNNPEFGGAAKRALDIAREIVAGYEFAQAYQNSQRPAFQLARWIMAHPNEARYQLPEDLWDRARLALVGNSGKKLVDIDHDDPQYDPGVNLVLAHNDTDFAVFDGVYGYLLTREPPEVDLSIQYQSEVNKPEYGHTPAKNHKPQDPDPMASSRIYFTRGGVKVYNPDQDRFTEPSTTWGRFLLNASVGLLALDKPELPLTEELKKVASAPVAHLGKELPKEAQIEFDPFEDIGKAAWGGL